MDSGLVVAVLVLSGIVTGLLSPLHSSDATAVAIAMASLAVAAVPSRARTVLIFGCLFWIAASEGALARDRAFTSPLQRWLQQTGTDDRSRDAVLVRGTLAADAVPLDAGVRLLIDVVSVQDAATWRPLTGRIQAHVSGQLSGASIDAWSAGRPIEAPIVLREPQVLHNPGSPSDEWRRLHRAADLVGTIKSAALVHVERAALWDEAAARLRRHVRFAASRYVAPHSAQSAAIVAAILIGDRAGLSEDVQRRLRAAGTYHVIAISGGNVAILAVCCVVVLRVAIRSFRGVAVTTMVVLAGYGWIVGNEPSVRRAVTAAGVYLAVSLIGLIPRPLNVLALTATLVAVFDPLVVVDAGAWLSFGATLGIILGAARFLQWATGNPPPIDRPRAGPERSSRARRVVRQIWLAILGLFSATLAAELALLPISAALFSRVSLLGLVLNFVAIPAMTVVQLAGLGTAVCARWWDAGARWCGWVADLAASWLVGSSAAVDVAPWLIWRVPPSSLVWMVTFYVGLAIAFAVRRRLWHGAGLGIAALSVATIVIAPGLEQSAPPAGRLRVTMFDVGQGEAILAQFPDRHSLLVDTGGSSVSTDFASRVLTPALWASGVRRLDWLAITHPDLDHIGGALGASMDFRPREIWEGIPVPLNAELIALNRQAELDRIVWRQVLSGHRLELGGVLLDVLHPPPPDWERRRVRNDDSVVLRLRFGAVEILLTGDAGREFEKGFTGTEPLFPVRVLKIGHHGSRTSSTASFLDAVRPHIALVSAGRGNLFGHPVPDVLARYERLGTIVFRTDRDGAIVMETDGREMDIRTMSGRRWRVRAN